MGMKFEAIKDDKILVKKFSAQDLEEAMVRMNDFLSHTYERAEWQEPDEPLIEKGYRIVPLGIAHSTEVVPRSGSFGIIDARVWYHVILTYKKVEEDE